MSAFGYSDSGARTVHPALNPYGVGVRESRDSAEHPASLAIAVLFDATGSMGAVPPQAAGQAAAAARAAAAQGLRADRMVQRIGSPAPALGSL